MKSLFTKTSGFMALLLALILTGCSDSSNPVTPPANQLTISSISPASASSGESVTITGQGFASTSGSNIVTFAGNAQANVTAASSTELTATVAEGAQDGPISVAVGSESVTSSDSFTYIE